MAHAAPAAAKGSVALPPRPARFDFPPLRFDQYGLPDSMVAAIKLSQGGGKQLESAAMQLNLDLVALTTLRAATKLGERALYCRESSMQQLRTQRPETSLDSEVGRLLSVISHSAKDNSAEEEPPGPPWQPPPFSQLPPPFAETPRALAGPWLHSVSDSGLRQPPASRELSASLSLPDTCMAVDLQRSSEPALDPLDLRTCSTTNKLAESENARINRHMLKLMEAMSSPQRQSPTSNLLPRSPPSPLTPTPFPLPAASPSKSQQAYLQGSPARPPSLQPPQRRNLQRTPSQDTLAAAATDTAAGFQACLPAVALKQRRSNGGAAPRSAVHDDGAADGAVAGAQDGQLQYFIRGQQQYAAQSSMQLRGLLMRRSVPERGGGDAGAAAAGSAAAAAAAAPSPVHRPGPGASRRARRASYSSMAGSYSPAPELQGLQGNGGIEGVMHASPSQLHSLIQPPPSPGSWRLAVPPSVLQASPSRSGRWRA